MYKRKTKDVYYLFVMIPNSQYGWEEIETAEDYKTIKYYLEQNKMIYEAGTHFKIEKHREKVDN